MQSVFPTLHPRMILRMMEVQWRALETKRASTMTVLTVILLLLLKGSTPQTSWEWKQGNVSSLSKHEDLPPFLL